MRAMVLTAPRTPLRLTHLPLPHPERGQVRLRIHACAVCRTDLHIVLGELPLPCLPLVPGHQIVGTIEAIGPGVSPDRLGEKVGAAWLGWSCGSCVYCQKGKENLCSHGLFTGYHRWGGFAEFCLAEEPFVFPLPPGYSDITAAPLLCAGMIGYRAWQMVSSASHLGLYGFGAAAHLLLQLAVAEKKEVYVFTRPEDREKQKHACQLGACWAGSSEIVPPNRLDAALLFAPVGALIPRALSAIDKGGCVVCAGIHMTDIPSFPYSLLWEERMVRSVANLTRQDGREFLQKAASTPLQVKTTCYPLEEANQALEHLLKGESVGSVVLIP